MPKLTINDKEYDTESFNEEQMAMYNEISVANMYIKYLKHDVIN